MQARFIYIVFCFLGFSLQAQNENMHWHFGNNAALDFRSGNPVPKNGSAMRAFEGCATISDTNGNMLFYTDGMQVWHKDNGVMQNGSGLRGNTSSTQSALILRKPGSSYLYYILTANGRSGNMNFGAYYTEVDMRLDNGRGGISGTMNNLIQASSDEKLTAVRHRNGKDIWILIAEFGSATINAYLLTEAGISTNPVVSSTGLSTLGTVGYLKVSPDAKKLAMCLHWNPPTDRLYIADFNNSNGRITNGFSFVLPGVYGNEFSPSGRFLYVGKEEQSNNIMQFDLEAGSPAQIEASKFILDSTGFFIGGLHLAPNGKIYVASVSRTFLSCIQYPDMYRGQCGWRKNDVDLGLKMSTYGLQNYMVSDYLQPHVTYKLKVKNCSFHVDFKLNNYADEDDVRWFFADSLADPASNSDDSTLSRHVYKASAIYKAWVEYRISNNQWKRIPVHLDLREPGLGTLPRCLQDSTGLCPGGAILLGCYIPGAYAYRWEDETRSYSGVQYAASLPQRLKYYFTDSNACRYTDSTVVFNYTPKTDLGRDTAICVYDSIWLKDLTGKTFRSYRWSNGDTTVSSKAFPGGRQILSTRDANGCTSADTVKIEALAIPPLELGRDTMLCDGESIYIPLQTPGMTYRLNGQPFNGIAELNAEGLYTVEIKQNGCINTDSIRLRYTPFPDTELGPDDSICFSNLFYLDAGPADTYRWNTGSRESSIRVVKPGTYAVESRNGRCRSTDTVHIYARDIPVFVPGAFSPGKDGHNDVFNINASIRVTDMQIFNRWGQLVFNSQLPNATWDGTYMGSDCQQDVYLVKISYLDCNGRMHYVHTTLHLLR